MLSSADTAGAASAASAPVAESLAAGASGDFVALLAHDKIGLCASRLVAHSRLTSLEPMVICRRFCQTWEQCNMSRFNELRHCEALAFVPRGNLVCLAALCVHCVHCAAIPPRPDARVHCRRKSGCRFVLCTYSTRFWQQLTQCSQKCSTRSNSNFEANCTKLSPGYCGASNVIVARASNFRSVGYGAILVGWLVALICAGHAELLIS